MITFILNNQLIKTTAPSGTALLDFIRKDKQLKGAKLVCKEGECGACTVLVGELTKEGLFYQSMTCLLYTSPSPRDRTRSRMPSSA